MIGLGIDTGGTCTDAVIYDLAENTVLASAKSLTTKEDLKEGICNVLEKLPRDLLLSCGTLALSTTLATNACVEGKWGKGRLILIGLDRKTLEAEYRKYGYDTLDDIYLLECRLTPSPDSCTEPDWEAFRRDMETFAGGCSCISIVQLFAREHHGRHEHQAARILREIYSGPVILGHSLFPDRNILRRGAGALLNARLIPVIYEFLGAIRSSLKSYGLDLPLLIMRSDGSLMSSDYTSLHPVETLLCGPAASVTGARNLAPMTRAVVVDMGGTTTDVSIISDGKARQIEGGIQIGDWKTFVKGLYVDTFALGGDTEVTFDPAGKLMLGTQRILPISQLASRYPETLLRLRSLKDEDFPSSAPGYEFFLLVKQPDDPSALSDTERAVCTALENGPLSRRDLASAVSRDIYTLKTDRLEQQGILLKAGLTPTDIMHIRGDFCQFDREAASLAAASASRITGLTEEEICETVYTFVIKRLYCGLVRILLHTEQGFFKDSGPDAQITRLIEQSFEDAVSGKETVFSCMFSTRAVLVGIGAPTRLFLEPAARLLHTSAVIPEHASVANAIGAIVGNVCASASTQIRPDSLMPENLQVIARDETRTFSEYDEACAYARRKAEALAVEALRNRGGKEPFAVTFSSRRQEAAVEGSALFLSETITADAAGKAV